MRWSAQETIRIPAARDDVFRVLTRIEDLPSWLSPVAGARLLAAEGDVRVVELVSGGAGGRRTVVELIEAEAESVLFAQVDRDRRRGVSGEARLRDAQGDTLVRVSLRVPSSPWRLDERRRLREGLTAALEALRRRCDRRERSSESRRLLSIRRGRNGSLELWLEGRSYELVPRESGSMEPGGG